MIRAFARTRLVVASAFASLILASGCNTTPLQERAWVEIRTPRFVVKSALGPDATDALVRNLEQFHRAVEFLLGGSLPPPATPIEVVAFDGRSIGRPFRVRGLSGYRIPRLRGDIVVLRTGDGWEDASDDLVGELAQELFRSMGALEWPLWYDEGLAQVASTLQIRGRAIDLGLPRADHVRRLRNEIWEPLHRVLMATDLSSWSRSDRRRFVSEAWALTHLLKFESRGDRKRDRLAHYGTLLAGGVSLSAAASEALGSDIEDEVRRYVASSEFRSLTLRGAARGSLESRQRTLSEAEILGALARLSLALGRTDQARSQVRRAAARGLGTAEVESVLGVASTLDGDGLAAEDHLEQALAAAPDDPTIHLDYGNALERRALTSAAPAERHAWLDRARSHYERCLELDPSNAEAHAMLATTHLVDGESPLAGIEHVERAQQLRPGSLELALLRAELLIASGARPTARAAVLEVISRAHRPEILDRAHALLAKSD